MILRRVKISLLSSVYRYHHKLAMLKGFEGKEHAELYAKYRPTYPDQVALTVVEYARNNKTNGDLFHMVDVGCGNGQSTEMYAQFFKQITALDTSASQIDEAIKRNQSDKIQYVVASAEKLPLDDESVDVICSAQAIHWADFPKFWNECRRVMKKDGSLVLYGYDMPHVIPQYAVDGANQEQLKQKARELTIKLHNRCRFHERIDHVNNLYAEIFDLIPCKHKQRDDTLKIERRMTLDKFGKYLSTWSGYQTYLRERTSGDNSPDILRQYLDELKKLYGQDESGEDLPVIVTWDVFILLSKRPD